MLQLRLMEKKRELVRQEDVNELVEQPAKFLVFLIKDKGAPALVPAE